MTRVNDARELDEQLSELVDWERFGVHLGMSKSEVDIIDRDKPDIASKKLTLFDKCLKANPSLNWEDVIVALGKIKENTLANKVKLAKICCTKVSVREACLDQPAIRVCSNIVSELSVLHNNFVTITQNLKKEIEIAFQNGSMTIKQFISRTNEERSDFPNEIWQVTDTYSFFRVIRPFYSFLDCYLIVCLASLFVSSNVAVEANEYDRQVKSFKESTDVIDLCGVLEIYFPQSLLYEGTSVQLSVVVHRSCGDQKLCHVEELIRVLFGLKKSECCLWFRVRPGSVILDFLLPQRLMMFAIVQCVNKLEFLQLMGVIAIRVGTILVMRKTEDKKFSFQNSFFQACKLGKIEFVELLLKFLEVNVNKPSEDMFLQQKDDTELSFILLLFELQVQFEVIDSAFTTAIIENEMIELSSLMSCVNEQRPSLASFFSSVANKSDFFSVAQWFLNFLNVSFLVAIEKESVQLCSDLSFDLENYAEMVKSIKKAASISCLEHSVQSKLQKPPPGTILTHIVLSSEWRACSISIIEKLVLSIFSNLKSPDELQWFEISSESNKIVAIFSFPNSFQKQLIKSSKEKLRFMKSLGISTLKICEEVVLQSNCDIFSFEKAFFEAKANNNVYVLKFLSEVQQDLLPMRSQGYFDENNNATFKCDPDSTALMISSAQGDLKLVKFLLDNGADPSIQTKTGATALLYAVYRGDYRTVQLFLEHNPHLVDISDLNKFSSLHIVCSLGNAKILKLFMKQKPDLNARSSNGMTPLFIACNELHVSLVSLLLKANVDPNIPDINATTPLSIASLVNCFPIVQCLLKAHADPNLEDKFGMTALFFAVKNNNLKIFKCLMDANADPCIETSFHTSAFHLACHAGFVKMLKHILKRTKPDFKLKNGLTPLCSACKAGQMEVVKRLIEANADANIQFSDDDGDVKIMLTPLIIACSDSNLEMVKLLLKAKADPNVYDKLTETFPVLVCAILTGSPAIVKTLLEAGADPDARSRDLTAPLHIACIRGNLKIVNHLLKAKANPNVLDNRGITPLLQIISLSLKEVASMFKEAFSSHKIIVPSDLNILYKIVDALLIAGADPNIPDHNNDTPLIMAVSKKMTNIVTRLLEEKANPNIQTTNGQTPLSQATFNKDPGIVKILLKQKADPNIVEYTNGIAPLHVACSPNGSLETVQAILSSSFTNPNILDATEHTPLHYAAFIANPKILQSLIASNANPNIKNQDGDTPLSILCDCHDAEIRSLKCLVEMVDILLGANADPNVQISKGKMWTPLHRACYMGWLEIVNSLLKAKANPNVKDENGFTPLMLMLQDCLPDTEGHTLHVVPNEYEIVDALLKAGADPNIVGIDIYNPIYVAAVRGEADIAARLLEGKADPNVLCSHEMITPLHYVCVSGCLGIVKILLKAKANPNIQDVHGATPLVLMLSDNKEGFEDPPNQYEIVDALLQAQADPNIANKVENYTPLVLAVSKGKTDIVARLLRGKANPHLQTNKGATPLHIATIYGHVEIIKILLKEKVDPNIPDYINGIAPLHIACGSDGSLEIAQVILSCPNTDPNILDGIKNTPLHYAVSSAQPKILQCLIESNANPNIRNRDGFTPLHAACDQACCTPGITRVNIAAAFEMTGILLKAKADPYMDSKLGTAFQIAIKYQNIPLLQLLYS